VPGVLHVTGVTAASSVDDDILAQYDVARQRLAGPCWADVRVGICRENARLLEDLGFQGPRRGDRSNGRLRTALTGIQVMLQPMPWPFAVAYKS